MLIPRNLHELIETLESLTSLSRCNPALTHLPIDALLRNILGGNASKARQSFECLVDPIRHECPQAADDLLTNHRWRAAPCKIIAPYVTILATCQAQHRRGRTLRNA